MRSQYNARELGRLLCDLPPFYFVESRALLQIIRVDPVNKTPLVWGTVVHNDHGEARFNWHEGCPAPQVAIIPAPPPDLTNRIEFPTAQVQDTILKLQAELARRLREGVA